MALIPLSYGFDEQAHCVRVSALVVRNLPSAIALLSARFLLAQADVPTRHEYVVAVVDPSERTAAAAYTNTARYVTRRIALLLAGLALRSALGAPFVIAGALKSAYDVGLYALFRNVDVENKRPPQSATAG